VAAGKEADEQLVDRFTLADDDAGHLLAHPVSGGSQFGEALNIGISLHGHIYHFLQMTR
jgi:hypothetical protein